MVEAAQLPQPQPIAHAGAAFGKAQGSALAIGVGEEAGSKFLLCPVRTGVFVIGEDGDALLLETQEEARGVALECRDPGG